MTAFQLSVRVIKLLSLHEESILFFKKGKINLIAMCAKTGDKIMVHGNRNKPRKERKQKTNQQEVLDQVET